MRMVHRFPICNFNWLRILFQKSDGLFKSAVFPSTFNFNQSAQTGLFEVPDRELHPTGRSGNFQHIGIFNSDIGQRVYFCESLRGALG